MNRITITKGKRAKKSNKGKTLGIIAIILIVIIITVLIILKFNINNQDSNVTEPEETIEQVSNTVTEVVLEEEPIQKQDEVVPVDDMPKTMIAKTKAVYHVLGKIVIEKINVEKYILDRTTDNSLDMAVARTKLDREINEVGNFCISGHNYKNIFKRLKELEIGDEFYLVGADGRKVTYVIYDKFSVKPSNDSCLDQNDNGKREVTLITCDPGAVTRLILKAEEKNLGGI